MKEYLSKQLMMLAILLFSGISGAFADNETFSITATSNHPNAIEVYFSSYGNSDVVAESGVACELTKGSTYELHIRNLNTSVYSISSITIDNNQENLKDQFDTDGIFFDDNNDHTIIITLAKAESKEITVNWTDGNDNGEVMFADENDERVYAHKPDNATSTTVDLAVDKDYNMYIIPYNPLKYSIQASVNGSNITESYNNKGYYPLPNDVNSVTVNFQQKSQETKYITVKWNTEVSGANVTITELQNTEPTNNEIPWVQSNSPVEVAAGTGYNYRITITPNNPLINYVDGIKIGNTNYGPKTSPDGSSYFDISNLTDDVTVKVTLAKKETKTITVTWPEGCEGINVYDQYDHLIEPQSFSSNDKAGTWVLPTGSTYQYHMIFTLSDPFTYCPSLTIAGTNAPVYATWKENNGWYKYDIDIENLSSEQQIDVSLVPVQTQEVTVDWGSDNHITVFFVPLYGGETIYATNGQPCYLAEGRSYEMGMEINNNIYELKSIQVDEGDNLLSDYNDNGFIAFPTVNAPHTVSIELTKKVVDTNTITVTWNNGDICHAEFRDNNLNWYYPRSGVPMEFPQNSTILLKGIIIDPLLYGIESVTVDNEDVTTQVNNGNEYEFENLSANHTVNITFGERSALKKNITVQYDDNHASADIYILNGEYVGNGLGIANNMPREAAAGEGFNYRVVIRLDNPQQYGISTIQVGGTDAEFTKTSMGGYVDIIGLTGNTTVTVTLEEKETKTVTVNWGEGCDDINVYDLNDNYISYQPYSYENKERTWVLSKGSTYRLIIYLSNPSDYFATVTGSGDPENATWNEKNGRYEYEIKDLSENLNLTISAVKKPSNEIAVTCDYLDVLYIYFLDQDDNWFGIDEEGKANFEPGKTYKMYINNRIPDVYSFNSIKLDGTTDFTGIFTDENGNNDYIEFENLDADHTVAITLNKEPYNTITVNRNNNLVRAQLRKVEGWSNEIKSKSDTESEIEWEVLPYKNYRVEIGVQNPLIDGITSVIIDKDTEGENNITSNFTDDDDTNNYIEFADISANHTIDVVATKQGETKAFTLESFIDTGDGENDIWYGNYSDVYLYDPTKDITIGTGNNFELLAGSTTQLIITPYIGYKVKTLTVDGVDKTETFNENNGYYEFANLNADHSIKIVFEEATTHYIIVTRNEEVGKFVSDAPGVHYDNVYNEKMYFNEGANVTMRIDSIYSNWANKYKLTKIMDGETNITPSTTNDNNQYEVCFNNLSANHNISLTYEQIKFHNVTVTFNDIYAQLETSSDNYGINSGESYKIEEGESVRLILNIGAGHKLTTFTVNGNSVDYKAGGIVLTESISGDIAVNVVTEEVESYYVGTSFSGYSQATIFMESDLFEKQETTWEYFNAGSDVTVTIVPSIGYEVSELVLRNNNNGQETNVTADYDEDTKKYSYEIKNLANNCYLRITTAKRSMVGIDDQSYTLNDIGMGTYCSEYDLDFTEIDGITAYIASGFDPSAGSIVLTKVYKVPAGTGIIIKGTPGNYSIPVAATKFFYSNMLVGVVTETQVKEFDGEYTNYILLKKADDLEPTFYRSSGGIMPANRAYLQIPSYLLDSSNNNSRITAVFDDDVTPIEDIQTNSDNAKDDDYYNLNGQKVKTVKKGIYIKNGKKVIIR